jgi:ABC-type amino acid transport substrate-binding protein
MDGGWRLTGIGKLLLFVVGLCVLSYAGWQTRDRWPVRAPADNSSSRPAPRTSTRPEEPATPRSNSSSSSGSGAVLANMRSAGVMRVGMEPDAPPLHYLNDKHQEEGFDFRIAGEVAKRLNVAKVQIVEADYEKLPDLVRDGKVDLLMGGSVPDPSIKGSSGARAIWTSDSA